MRKISLTALALVLSITGLARVADAQQKRDPVDEKKAMEMMTRAATPGAEHVALNAMVGTFDAKVKMWTAPGTTPQESTGKSVNEWVLGKRWVEQHFDGMVMGTPFSGIGYTGYNNVTHMYVGAWMDTMSTSLMMNTGNPDLSGKTWTFTGTMDDPVSGEPTQVDTKVTFNDNDHHRWEMWAAGSDGTVFKMMEITYTRKK